MNIKYINHIGEELDLTGETFKMLKDTDLFNYEWDYITKNEYNPEVTKFTRSMNNKSISIALLAANKEEYNANCNKLLEVFEKDINSVKTGRLYVDDYYLPCYIIGKDVQTFSRNAKIIVNTFTILTEKGRWLKDVEKLYGHGLDPVDTPDTDYPRDYPRGYVYSRFGNVLVSDSFVPFDFEISIEGPAENPTIMAGENIYRVFTTLASGEHLIINSKTKKITKIQRDGTEVNEFYLRDRDNYIFEKMPVINGGTYIHSGDESLVFSIKAFTERSEPKWT